MGSFLDSFNNNIAIDLGSTYTRVCNNDSGTVVKELSLVALDRRTMPAKVVEVGNAAPKLTGRAKGEIKTVSPLRRGVIAEIELAVPLIKSLINKVLDTKLIRFSPKVIVSIPANATGVERKATKEAMLKSGARKVFLIEEPLSAAIGAGIDIFNTTGKMIVDIGGGSTDISVLNYADIVVNNNVQVAGNDFDKAIQNYLRTTKQLFVSQNSAENLKIKYGNVFNVEDNEDVVINGLDILTKTPVTRRIMKSNIKDALTPPVKYIAREIQQTLELTPPELISEIVESGIMLTGGSSLLNGLSDFLQDELGLKVILAPDPMLSVVLGSDKIQNDYNYRKLLFSKKD